MFLVLSYDFYRVAPQIYISKLEARPQSFFLCYQHLELREHRLEYYNNKKELDRHTNSLVPWALVSTTSKHTNKPQNLLQTTLVTMSYRTGSGTGSGSGGSGSGGSSTGQSGSRSVRTKEGPGYYKYACKYKFVHPYNCPNFITGIFNVPCANCMVS